MINRIRDFLWSLRSEKAKRREMQRGFDSVFETPGPEAEKREAFVTAKKDEWAKRIVENLIVGVISSLIATAIGFCIWAK